MSKQDIALSFIDSEFNLELEAGDLKGDAGLENAVIISLFSDRRVSPIEAPGDHLGGWFGDQFGDIQGDKIGSKLWIYNRAKLTNDTIQGFEFFARKSLDWMLADKLAKAVDVVVTRQNEAILLNVTITRPDDSNDSFAFIWDGQLAKRG